MRFYRSFTQFYPKSGNSTGGNEVPVDFDSVEDALKDCKEWLAKWKTHIDPEQYEMKRSKYSTTYTWTGEFEIYAPIKDVLTLSYQHQEPPKEK